MMVLVDTSAIFAALSKTDDHFAEASVILRSLLEGSSRIQLTSYVISETLALLQNRLGFAAAQRSSEDLLPVLDPIWIDEKLHRATRVLWLRESSRKISFVDCSSVAAGLELGIRKIFAFDSDFERLGLELVDVSSFS